MRFRQRFLPYEVAISSTAIALLLTLGLEPFLTQVVSPFFFVAITVSTWYGGLKPEFVSIVLSTLAINHFFVHSVGQVTNLSISDVIRFITFCLVAVVIHLLSHNLRNSKRRVEQLIDERKQAQERLQQQFEQQRLVMEMTQRIRLDLERLESGRAVLEKMICQAADLMQKAVDGVQLMPA